MRRTGPFRTLLAAAGFGLLPLFVGAQNEVIVDNSGPGFATAGTGWFSSSNTGFYGTNSLLNFAGTGTATATWTANLPAAGEYEVFAWWVASSNRGTNVTYSINSVNGIAQRAVNQTANGSRWNSLGAHTFGTTGVVSVSDAFTTGDYVSADAIRFLATGNSGSTPCLDPIPAPALASGSGSCSLCNDYILPGAVEPHPDTAYYIHSDLPEAFGSTGVLYATTPVLPASATNPLPLNVRTQVNNGFTSIDDDFDAFLFHISQPGDGTQVRRMTVYVRNDGTGPVTINPKQLMITDGVVGDVHEMESNLGRRAMNNEWDTPITSVTLQPGQGNIIAYSKQFPGFPNGSDRSANVNCFARVRANVNNPNPAANPTRLTVYVVAINAAPISENRTRAEALLNVAAQNNETGLDLTRPPQGCELSRACGVVRTFQWRSDLVEIDAASLPANGYSFSMALPRVQTTACPTLRQTADMTLRPGFAPPDTVGNYMIDYRVHFRVINRDSTAPRAVDLQFSKSGADIGLAYKIGVSNTGLSDSALDAIPAVTSWAGPNQSAISKSFLGAQGGSVTVPSCGERHIDLRFQVLGNASLPFSLQVLPSTNVQPVENPGTWMIY